MNIWGRILKWCGWSVEARVPWREKAMICVAPHTSNYDFLLGIFAWWSLGRKANFLMKDFWFFFPLGILLRKIGGIPVKRDKHTNMTDQLLDKMRSASYMNLAVTPEGTRSATSKWRRGFLFVAQGAGVPIQLAVIDYGKKEIFIDREFHTTGNVDADMQAVKQYYAQFTDAARYPDKFMV